MKKTQFLVAAIVAIVFSAGTVKASENKSANIAKQELSSQIKMAFNTTPLNDLMEESTSLISVIFRINDNHEFELIHVEGENEELVRYSTLLLKHMEIKADPSVVAQVYTLPVRFSLD